jgi:hypothetical protein
MMSDRARPGMQNSRIAVLLLVMMAGCATPPTYQLVLGRW